jgi:RNA recognition motif-containing protein
MDIFVGNLPLDVGQNDLREIFEKFGEVTEVRLIKEKSHGKFKGYAFIEMPSKEEAQKAIEETNGKDLKEKPMTVKESNPRKPHRRKGRAGGKTKRAGKGRRTVYGGEDRPGFGNSPRPRWPRK